MPFVTVDKPRPHVSLITLNRPERLNAMSFDVVGPLYEAIDQVGADNDTWATVLTGAGRGFCSGLDLEDHGVPPGMDGLPISFVSPISGSRASSLSSPIRPMWRKKASPSAKERSPRHWREFLSLPKEDWWLPFLPPILPGSSRS